MPSTRRYQVLTEFNDTCRNTLSRGWLLFIKTTYHNSTVACELKSNQIAHWYLLAGFGSLKGMIGLCKRSSAYRLMLLLYRALVRPCINGPNTEPWETPKGLVGAGLMGNSEIGTTKDHFQSVGSFPLEIDMLNSFIMARAMLYEVVWPEHPSGLFDLEHIKWT